MCVANQVRRDFFDNAVSIGTVGLGNSSGDASRGHLANGKLHASLDQRIHFARLSGAVARACIYVDFGRLLGLGIGEFSLLGELLAILRPNRVVISKRCGLVTRDNHNGQVTILQAVAFLVRRKVVPGELERPAHAVSRRGVKQEAVHAGNFV